MAKLTAQPLILFGRDGSASYFNKFGSRAAGSAVSTKDVSTIQSSSAWLAGIQDAILAGAKAPFLQDFNGLFYVLSYQQAYTLQEGIPEWESTRTYYIGSIVKKTGTFELYGSLTNDNTGNALPSQVNSANWTYLGTLGQQASGTDGAPGDVKYTARSTPPSGWLECDGSAISRITYSSLFSAISTTHGVGDGSTTFNIPDLRGVFIRGYDHGAGKDSGRSFGSYQDDAFQDHWHQTWVDVNTGNANHGNGSANVDGVGGNLNSPSTAVRQPMPAGSGPAPRTTTETRPKNVALLPIIKY